MVCVTRGGESVEASEASIVVMRSSGCQVVMGLSHVV